MAFPVVAATNTSTTSAASTTHTVNLPSSIASGDLLLVFIVVQTGTTSGSFSASGWTQLLNAAFNTFQENAVLYRVADGTEGSTVTVTSPHSGKAAHASYRVTGASGTWVIGGKTYAVVVNPSASATPNPPLCPASGGTSDDYLWIAAEFNDGTDLVTVWPTNYASDRLNPTSGGSGGAGTKATLGVATRTATAASEDPGTFTIAASEHWSAATLGVQPAAVAAQIPYTNPYLPLLAQ